jgi:hypothetical protein
MYLSANSAPINDDAATLILIKYNRLSGIVLFSSNKVYQSKKGQRFQTTVILV